MVADRSVAQGLVMNRRAGSEGRVRRWITRALALVGVAGSIPVLVQGCDSPTQFNDLCGWLRDPNNCYREFFIDVGTRCGTTPNTRPGQFVSRDKLDQCFLEGGGIVTFEPPIDFNDPPNDRAPCDPAIVAGGGDCIVPPLKFTFTNPDATECGSVEFTGKYDFVVTVNGDPRPEDTLIADLPEDFVLGGTFTMKGGLDTDILDVTCPLVKDPDPTVPEEGASTGENVIPTGDVFKFDRLQVTRCRNLEPILPHAEIDFSPGGVDQVGVVRLNVFYPPQEGALEGAQPVPVNYFECFIPAAPPACANGVKDGAETDIDCGGGFCTTRCGDGQACINNNDCSSGACIIDMGLKKCNGD